MQNGKGRNGRQKDITLHDVIIHMEHMEQRLSKWIRENTKKIEENSRKIEENTKRIASNEAAIGDLKTTFTQRIDALEEDLTATIKDTVKIRKYVGMPLPKDF